MSGQEGLNEKIFLFIKKGFRVKEEKIYQAVVLHGQQVAEKDWQNKKRGKKASWEIKEFWGIVILW